MRTAGRLRNAALAGLIPAFLCCAPASTPAVLTNHPTLFVTPALARELPQVAGALVEAADIWCRRGYGCVRVVVGNGTNEARIIDYWNSGPASQQSDTVIAFTHERPGFTDIYFLRYYFTGDPIVYDTDRCDTPELIMDPLWIATHELGHFLGVSHSADERSVMYPDASCSFTFVP